MNIEFVINKKLDYAEQEQHAPSQAIIYCIGQGKTRPKSAGIQPGHS